MTGLFQVGAARPLTRKELEAEIDRLISLLDTADGDTDLEPSLGAPDAYTGSWRNAGGNDDDRELDSEDEGAQCEDEGAACEDEGEIDHDHGADEDEGFSAHHPSYRFMADHASDAPASAEAMRQLRAVQRRQKER